MSREKETLSLDNGVFGSLEKQIEWLKGGVDRAYKHSGRLYYYTDDDFRSRPLGHFFNTQLTGKFVTASQFFTALEKGWPVVVSKEEHPRDWLVRHYGGPTVQKLEELFEAKK